MKYKVTMYIKTIVKSVDILDKKKLVYNHKDMINWVKYKKVVVKGKDNMLSLLRNWEDTKLNIENLQVLAKKYSVEKI